MRRGLAAARSDGDDRYATDSQRAKSVHRTGRATSSKQYVSKFSLIFGSLEILLKLRRCCERPGLVAAAPRLASVLSLLSQRVSLPVNLLMVKTNEIFME